MEIMQFWYALAAVLLIQLVFFLYYSTGLIRIRRSSSSEELDGVSVIVAAKNECKNLSVLIPRIFDQDYPNKELIIVNDQSVDGTYDLLLEMKAMYLDLKIVNVESTPDHISRKKYAITLGVKAAKYDQLLFTDADCIPTSNQWISQFASKYGSSKSDIIVGFSPYRKKKGLLNLLIRFETMLTGLQYMGKAGNGRSYMGVGRNLAYRKSFFLENNGFGRLSSLVSGDDDLFVNAHSTKSNTNAVLNSEAVTYSIPKNNLKEYIQQKKRHYSVGKYYKFIDKFFLGLFTITRYAFWIFLVAGLYLTNNYYLLTSVFVGWALIYSLSLGILSKKSGTQFPVFLTAILDLFFNIFYIVAVLMTLTSKEVKWK